MEIEENWVIDSMEKQHPMRGIRPMFGAKVERYVDSLGCAEAGCRTTAMEQIRALEGGGFRPLVWAARHKNQAIANSALWMLRGFYTCDSCEGTGWTPNSDDLQCFLCKGMGDLRKFDASYYYKKFSDNAWSR